MRGRTACLEDRIVVQNTSGSVRIDLPKNKAIGPGPQGHAPDPTPALHLTLTVTMGMFIFRYGPLSARSSYALQCYSTVQHRRRLPCVGRRVIQLREQARGRSRISSLVCSTGAHARSILLRFFASTGRASILCTVEHADKKQSYVYYSHAQTCEQGRLCPCCRLQYSRAWGCYCAPTAAQ